MVIITVMRRRICFGLRLPTDVSTGSGFAQRSDSPSILVGDRMIEIHRTSIPFIIECASSGISDPVTRPSEPTAHRWSERLSQRCSDIRDLLVQSD